TGIGIPEEAQRNMFRKFTQGDASVTRRFGGTGLGLAISKELIHMMGGQIGLKSTLSEGSTFWVSVTLPVPAETTGTANQPLSAPAAPGTRWLIAEPQPLNRKFLSEALASYQITYETVSTGKELLTALERGIFDVVLLDRAFWQEQS